MTKLTKTVTALGLAAGLAATTMMIGGPVAHAEQGAGDTGEWVRAEPAPGRVAVGLDDFDVEADAVPLILNGEGVDGNQYPWSAFLVITDGFGGSTCGGSVVKKQWIMTAAHCVVDGGRIVPPSWVYVSIGGPNRPTSLSSGRFKRAAEVWVRSDYNPRLFRNDLALIKLRQPIKNAKPLSLASPGEKSTRQGGNRVTVAGWGVQNPNASTIPVRQQKVTLPLRSKGECRNDYGGYRHNIQLCVGWKASESNRPQGSCVGDSGSALFAYTKYGPSQIGVVSFGFGSCTSLQRFGYYTRVDTYRKSVAELINGLPRNPGVPRCSGRKATMTGTVGADVLVGTNGKDVIVSLGGDDRVDARNGNDVICLGTGNDTGRGGGGRDEVLGEGGADKIMGGSKADRLFGNDGVDRIFGEDGGDLINGGDKGDKLRGQGQADRILGGSGEDDIDGGDGDDELLGQGAGDTLNGERGDDDLEGGPGSDTCDGGVGTDRAVGCETKLRIP